jgi:hypothetical protein
MWKNPLGFIIQTIRYLSADVSVDLNLQIDITFAVKLISFIQL